MRPILTAVSLAPALLAAGCATIVHGGSQDVPLTTDPAGATCLVDDGLTVVSPSTVKLSRKQDHVLTITKDGYAPQTIPLTSVTSGWLAGNLVVGGLVGAGIDGATGASCTLTPERVAITLAPLPPGHAAPAPSHGTLSNEERLKIAEQMHSDGMLNNREIAAVRRKLGPKPATPPAPPSQAPGP